VSLNVTAASKVAWWTFVVGFLIVFFGNLALRAMSHVRGEPAPLDGSFLCYLALYSLGVAVAVAAGAGGWRLIQDDDTKRPGWGVAVGLIALVLFVLFVWPTRWKHREFGCHVVRIERFTGTLSTPQPLPGCQDAAPAATPRS
jgi:hypothetical protein